MPSHLTESDIQAMSEKGIASSHVSSCGSCRKLYREYLELFNRLAEEPPYLLPADFAKRTAARSVPRRESLWPKVLQSIAILAASAVVFGLIQNFIGLVFFHQGWNVLAAFFHSTWTVILSAFKAVHDGLGKGFGMVIQAGIILFTFGILDRMWRRVRSG